LTTSAAELMALTLGLFNGVQPNAQPILPGCRFRNANFIRGFVPQKSGLVTTTARRLLRIIDGKRLITQRTRKANATAGEHQHFSTNDEQNMLLSTRIEL